MNENLWKPYFAMSYKRKKSYSQHPITFWVCKMKSLLRILCFWYEKFLLFTVCLCLKVPRKSWYKEKHENSEGLSCLVKPHLWPPHNKMWPPFVNLCEWLCDSDPKRLGFVASSWKLEVCKRYIYSSCFYIEFIIGGFW